MTGFLKKYSIRQKVLLMGVAVIALMAGLIVCGSIGYNRIVHNNLTLGRIELSVRTLEATHARLTELLIVPDRPDYITEIRQLISKMDAELAGLSETNAEFQKALNETIIPPWTKARGHIRQILEIPRLAADTVTAMIKYGQAGVQINKAKDGLSVLHDVVTRRSERDARLVAWVVGSIAVLNILIIIVVMRTIYLSVAKPVSDFAQATTLVAQGDLTASVHADSDDEVGALAVALNTMTGTLKKMLREGKRVTDQTIAITRNVAGASTNIISVAETQAQVVISASESVSEMGNTISLVAENSEKLAESSNSASAAASQLTASVAQVAQKIAGFHSSADQAVESVNSMVQAIDSIAISIDNLSALSKEATVSIERVKGTILQVEQNADATVLQADTVARGAHEKAIPAIENAVHGIQNVRQCVTNLRDTITRLGRKSHEIGSIITIIDDIADKIRMIALNTSIMAAQAGEHGKSFSIVAAEIKDLSARTFKSTREIAELITMFQAEAGSTEEMAQAGMDAVENGLGLVINVSAILQQIHQSASTSAEMSRAIKAVTREEAQIIGSITENVMVMVQQIDHINSATKSQTDGSKFIFDEMQKIKQVSRELMTATREQAVNSKQISDISFAVFQQAQSISAAIADQKNRAFQISESVDIITGSAKDLAGAADVLDSAVTTLRENADTMARHSQRFKTE